MSSKQNLCLDYIITLSIKIIKNARPHHQALCACRFFNIVIKLPTVTKVVEVNMKTDVKKECGASTVAEANICLGNKGPRTVPCGNPLSMFCPNMNVNYNDVLDISHNSPFLNQENLFISARLGKLQGLSFWELDPAKQSNQILCEVL